jgi:hypothetical protein
MHILLNERSGGATLLNGMGRHYEGKAINWEA